MPEERSNGMTWSCSPALRVISEEHRMVTTCSKEHGVAGIKVIQMQALMDVPKIYCSHSTFSLLMEEDDCAAHPACVLTG